MKNKISLVGFLLSYLLFLQGQTIYAQHLKTNKPDIDFGGVLVAWDNAPAYMSDLYNGLHGTDMVFDSCKIVNQDNGYKIIIAKGMDMDTIVRFAYILEYKDGFQTRDNNVTTTCECRGICASGCDPEYLGNNKWLCSECQPLPNTLTQCIKVVTAQLNPGTNQKAPKIIYIYIGNERVTLSDMPARMEKIYSETRKETAHFTACSLLTQDNGYTILVAEGQNDTAAVHFAIPIKVQDSKYYAEVKPTTTCACIGECQLGCDPEYLGGYRWICTACEYNQGQVESTCIKSVTATSSSDNQ